MKLDAFGFDMRANLLTRARWDVEPFVSIQNVLAFDELASVIELARSVDAKFIAAVSVKMGEQAILEGFAAHHKTSDA